MSKLRILERNNLFFVQHLPYPKYCNLILPNLTLVGHNEPVGTEKSHPCHHSLQARLLPLHSVQHPPKVPIPSPTSTKWSSVTFNRVFTDGIAGLPVHFRNDFKVS